MYIESCTEVNLGTPILVYNIYTNQLFHMFYIASTLIIFCLLNIHSIDWYFLFIFLIDINIFNKKKVDISETVQCMGNVTSYLPFMKTTAYNHYFSKARCNTNE
jgi:hypothetical protein